MTSNPSWLDSLLDRLGATGEAGEAARCYLRDQRVRVSVHKQPTGARWTLFGHIELSPAFDGKADDPFALSLLVHEVEHLKQGWLTALSVQGELLAWQVQFAYFKSLTETYSVFPKHEAIIAELMSLIPSNRDDLKRARALMRKYAGEKYRINWLPLYPLGREIGFWVTGKRIDSDAENAD